MIGPILFAVYVATFIVILYAAEHFLATRWSVLRSNDTEPVAIEAARDCARTRERD